MSRGANLKQTAFAVGRSWLMTYNLNPLFLHTVRDVPLTAELFRYAVINDIRELDARFRICRSAEGSVYLGFCETARAFGEESGPFGAVVIWDVSQGQFTIRDRTTGEQSVSSSDGILGTPHTPVPIQPAQPFISHLGYSIYPVKASNNLFYSPALELALIHEENFENGIYEFVVQSVERGEPDVSVFNI